MKQQTERFVLIALVSQPVQCQLCGDVGCISGVLFLYTVVNKERIVVIALTDKDIPVIESGGVGGEVPFTNYGSLVPGLLQ